MYLPPNPPIDEDRIQLTYNHWRKYHSCNPIQAGMWVHQMTTDRWDWFVDHVIPVLEERYKSNLTSPSQP